MRRINHTPFRASKTAYLKTLLPDGVVLNEHWVSNGEEKFFSAWYIYRHYGGLFGWIRNFFVMEPMIALDNGMSPATVFDNSEPELVQKVLNALSAGVYERYQVEMHTMGVPAFVI